MRSCGTPDTNVTTSFSPSRSSTAGILLLSFCLPMTTRCTSSRSTRSFATASSSGTRPFIGTSALAVVMMRPGTRLTCGIGRKLSWSTPTGTMCSRSSGTPICATMSRARVLAHGDEARDLLRDLHLHLEERVPTAQRGPLPRRGRVLHVEVAVDGDRVVQGGDDRPTVVHHPEQPGAEALVVVDEVEVVAPLRQQVPGPEAERVRLGEARRAHDGELLEVDPVPELPRPRHPEGVARLVEVEARDLHQLGRVVELGPGLAGEHLDVVTELGDLTGEVPGVDPLTPAMRVPAVDQPGDSEGASGARHEAREPRSRGPDRSWSGPVACRARGALDLSPRRGSDPDRRRAPLVARRDPVGLDRVLRGPGRSRGRRRPTARGAAGLVTPDLAVTGVGSLRRRGLVLGIRRPRSSTRRPTAACRGRRRRRPARGSCPAPAGPPRPPPTPGSSISRSTKVTHATSPGSRSTAAPGRPGSRTAATSPGTPTLVDAGRGLGRVGPARRCRSTSPGSCSPPLGSDGGARGGRRRRPGLGRPAPLLARRVAPRVRLGRDRLVERLGRGRRRLRTRARCSRRTHDHAAPTWSPGQRSFAWSPDGTDDRAVPERGRVRRA